VQGRALGIELMCSYDNDPITSIFNKESSSSSEVDKPTVFIDVDKAKFTQVLRNLLSNALKFSPENSVVKLHVTSVMKYNNNNNNNTHRHEEQQATDQADTPLPPPVSTDHLMTAIGEGTRFLRVEVHDSGEGISSENVQKLFGSIIQFDAAKLQGGGGSGIGLFVSKGIMDLHGGYIGAYSRGVGFGSTFYVEIPISKSKDNSTSSSSLSSSSPSSSSSSSSSHYLSSKHRSNSQEHAFSELALGRIISEKMIVDSLLTYSSEDSDEMGTSNKAKRRHMTPTAAAAAADGDDTIGFDNIQNTPTTAATATTTTVRKPKQNSSTPLPALNILLVDDSSSTRKMLARYLRMAKMCECPDEAEDGFDAIEKVKSQNDINYYHVILVRGRDGEI
jgi:hypothetical protein